MNKPPESLPPLTLNRRFVQDFLAQDAPCFALGLIEAQGQPCAVLALRPGVAIPPGITDLGFNLGHTVLGDADFELIHFAFEFYGFATYNVLLNPSNPHVRTVVSRMLEHGGYFIMALGPEQQVCAFRAEVGAHDLRGLRDHRRRINGSTTTPAQYRETLAQFRARPNPPGRLLNWVCRDQAAALDLTTDRLELAPAQRARQPDDAGPRALAAALDAHVTALTQGGLTDVDLFVAMADHLPLIKQLMDQASPDELSALCAAYPGMYRFAKVLEQIAADIATGDIKVPG